MKRLFYLPLLLLLACGMPTGVMAQEDAQQKVPRGISLGVDRDTLLWLIASPFDNWYITVGGGVQTFIGNELVASARMNKLNYTLKAEVGKWIIPDLAVSLRLTFFNVDGQSQYGLQPFIDPTSDAANSNGYYPFYAHAAALTGYVTLDWTNLFMGYERGKANRWHVYTPVGLGMSILLGDQRNPRTPEGVVVGDLRHNWELAYSGGIGVEYYFTPHFAVNMNVEVFGSESTWDWSPYNNGYGIFDVMPNITVGARFGIGHHMKGRRDRTGALLDDTIYHEFQTIGSRHSIERMQNRVERLERDIDKLQNLSDQRALEGAAITAALEDALRERDSLQEQLDSMPTQPVNVFQELADLIIPNGLPSTVVYYQLDKWDLDLNAHRRLRKFAKEMNQLSDTLEFYVLGAADSLTGSKRHNDWLSEHRCQAARDALVKTYGVNPNQLILVPMGGITAYEPKEVNRMAMVILRTPEVDAVIRKWTRYKK